MLQLQEFNQGEAINGFTRSPERSLNTTENEGVTAQYSLVPPVDRPSVQSSENHSAAIDSQNKESVRQENAAIVSQNKEASEKDSGSAVVFPQNRCELPSNLLKTRNSLQRELDSQVDAVEFDTADLEFVPDGLRTGSRVIEYDERFVDTLCKRVSAPSKYVQTLPRPIRVDVLNHHLNNAGMARIRLWRRNDRIIGIGDDLHSLPATEVLDQVLLGIGNIEIESHRLEITQTGFSLCLLAFEQHAVAVNDPIQAGIQIEHSLIGEYATRVETFVLRLVCTNGMTHRDCVSKKAARTRRLPLDKENAIELQQQQIRSLVRETWENLDEKLSELRTLQERREDVPRLLESSLRRARINRRVAELVLAAWQHGQLGNSRWAAVNALTEIGTHDESISIRERRALMALAGLLSFAELHLCERCYSLIHGIHS